eukprot:CAMPEP_0184292812 /NCGR_PEP_ID=MMETSP1049-20130417/4503_1 /TAXON_ID=77928 /ORGANISM="Proteomonas sulcata, Strain CCMP704" /LENGTH=189 /DNA_ID=CAMNT_0026600709 /DNA_START=31 /DNA_END=600 /DNA_ORIENTATION=-
MKNLGTAHLARGALGKALTYLTKALQADIAVYGPSSLVTARTLNNLGYAYLEIKKYDKALQRFEQALDIRLNLLGERHTEVAKVVKNMGHVHLGRGDPDRALRYYQKALSIEQESSESRGEVALTKLYLGRAAREVGDLQRAKKLFQAAATEFGVRFGTWHPLATEAEEAAEQLSEEIYRQTWSPGDNE